MRSSQLTIAAAAAALWLALTPGASAQPPGPGPDDSSAGISRHDLNGDGVITAEEFALSDPRFQYLDADGNGQITAEEIEATRASQGTRSSSQAGAGIVLAADTDRDHEVTADEWQKWLNTVDPNDDGTITADELKAVFAARHSNSRFGQRGAGSEGGYGPPDASEMADRVTAHLDANGDGTLGRDDLNQIFNSLDANGDGTLQSDELPQPPGFGSHGGHFSGRRGGFGGGPGGGDRGFGGGGPSR